MANKVKRKVPDTSSDAYKSAKLGLIDSDKKKIIAAFKVLGSATADEIGKHLGWDHVKVNRRFKELRDDNTIYNTFEKRNTSKGRAAYVHTLNITGEKVEKKSEKAMPGKSVGEYSKEILNNKYKQQNLF